MGFAYKDSYGILKIVPKKEIAGDRKTVETDFESFSNYPVVGDQFVVVYSETEAYIGGNRKDGQPYDLQQNPKLLALYKSV
jgi:hypothetical protein